MSSTSLLAEWLAPLAGAGGGEFERTVLPRYLQSCRWFAGKAHKLTSITARDAVPVGDARLVLLDVSYDGAPGECYLLALQWVTAKAGDRLRRGAPNAVVAQAGTRLLIDAIYDEDFRERLFQVMLAGEKLAGEAGCFEGECGSALKAATGEAPSSRVLSVEQSNSSIIYSDRFFLKLYRKVEPGINPDCEITRFLTEKAGFRNAPAYAGSLSYRAADGALCTTGLLVGMVPNQGDAWSSTLSALREFYTAAGKRGLSVTPGDVRDIAGEEFFERVRQLARRTAEMHLALASGGGNTSGFETGMPTIGRQADIFAAMTKNQKAALALLDRARPRLTGSAAKEADRLRAVRERLPKLPLALFKLPRLRCREIRVHGDYHLGQVLDTGGDFVIIDFEGEPLRSIAERRKPSSALRDVAGMMRSFHYAAHAALLEFCHGDEKLREQLDPLAEEWAKQAGHAFFDAWSSMLGSAPLVPQRRKRLDLMLLAWLLDKAVYELAYELNNRPDWAFIPLRGITSIMDRFIALERAS